LILGRASFSTVEQACRREWLVSNALGGYACGTVGGIHTRRYHGWLIASLAPPVKRTLVLAKVEVSLEYLGRLWPLGANEFAGGALDPQGFRHLESFEVAHGIPCWHYAIADALIEQRLYMDPQAQTSYLTLEVLRASAPLRAFLKPLVTHRDHHAHGRGAHPVEMRAGPGELAVRIAEAPCRLELRLEGARFAPLGEWYWNFFHREEFARGLDALEDLYAPGTFERALEVGEPLVLSASIEERPARPAAQVRAELEARSAERRAALPAGAPAYIETLATASDTFVARRGASAEAGTLIAGFPWFADWSRDTMIALPGLATALGRHDLARSVLRTYAGALADGLLPNRFPEDGGAPEYHTADATLWFFQALGAHLEATRDAELARELAPLLIDIVRTHLGGTHFGIRIDPEDGLLRAGERGRQLTWMDAKHGEEVFTPRIGKPVEINALWLGALELTAQIAKGLRQRAEERLCRDTLERARAGFQRFWNESAQALYDVLDVDAERRADARVRPNQIFAVSLPGMPLTPGQQRAIVERCARELLTSYGLRSLSPADPEYRGHYRGNAWERDAAYHQGTVWSWLLGPFALAHHRVFGDAGRAQALLSPIAQHLLDAGIGQVSEIFEGDAPHEPRGCIAQAWSVAEILRAWIVLERARRARRAAATPAKKPAPRARRTGG